MTAASDDLGIDVSELERALTESLWDGGPLPADAPAWCGDVITLVERVRQPGTADELAAEATVVAQMHEVLAGQRAERVAGRRRALRLIERPPDDADDHPPAHAAPPGSGGPDRRFVSVPVVGRVLAAKAAAAATAAVLGITAAAAASGVVATVATPPRPAAEVPTDLGGTAPTGSGPHDDPDDGAPGDRSGAGAGTGTDATGGSGSTTADGAGVGEPGAGSTATTTAGAPAAPGAEETTPTTTAGETPATTATTVDPGGSTTTSTSTSTTSTTTTSTTAPPGLDSATDPFVDD